MMNTVSFIEGNLHDYLSSVKHTTIIDALRPNSTYTLEINDEKIIDIYTDANGKFMDILSKVVLRILAEKKPNINVEQIYKNLKFRIVTSNKLFMHNLNSKNHENIIVTFDCDVIAAEHQMTYTTECDLICPKCYKRTFVKCNFNKKLPTIHCDNFSCKKALLEVEEETAQTDNLQHVLLQEFMEDSVSSSPVILEGLITGDLVGSIFVGQKKRITGLYRSVFNTKTNENKILIDVISEQDLDNSCDTMLTDDELNIIKKLIDQDDFLTKICSSFAPQIYGYEVLKKSILLQLAGGVGGLKRGDVNVLLVGDPSMAKSELLKFANKITQKSIYTSGKGSSAAGLTIGLVKLDNGKHVAQAGVLPLCSGGFAFIDEFDKMNTIDRSGLHEAMEQQTVSIAKAGFRMTLPSKTAILAAANPKFGTYDIEESLATNIDVPPPLLSRFDLIFLIRDTINSADDEMKAKFILDTFVDGIEKSNVLLEPELLSAYLNYARKLKPVLTSESQEHILNIYKKMRDISAKEGSSITIGTRQLEAIVRLSTAHAKLHLRNEINKDDVNAIEVIIKSMFESFGFDFETGKNKNGNTVGSTTKSESKEQVAHRVWNDCKDSDNKVRHTLFIQLLGKEDNYTEEQAKKIFGLWEQNCIVKLNKDGTYQKL
jgi:replicative DNA helicase Mcm